MTEELIIKSAALDICEVVRESGDCDIRTAAYRIRRLPAVDAVEVVRCKDCKHMAVVGGGYRWCKAWERIQTMGDEGYCCFGERRADND